jgi:hypothetical protein
VIRELLNGFASPETRATLERARPQLSSKSVDTMQQTLRELVALALASPEFQRR